jgi:carbamoyltransferase
MTVACQNQHYADIAASIQKVTEEVLLGMATHLQRATDLKNLFCGRRALNSVANGRLLRETPFEELFIQPAAGDGEARSRCVAWLPHGARQAPRVVMRHALGTGA